MVAFKNLALLIVLTGHTLSLPTAVELDARAAALSCPGSNNAAYTASSGRQYTIECGADHPGNMRVVYARTMESCVSACDSTDGCVAVSWVRRFGACYMKSSVLPATSNNRVWGAVLRSGSPAGTTAAAPSTAAAPPPPPPSATAAASPPPPSVAAASTSSRGKRGLAYNTASLTNAFSAFPKIGWAYDWAHNSRPNIASTLEYVPMIWGTDNNHVGNWFNDAKAAIASGTRHLTAFNEPDHNQQSNLSPGAAAAGYRTYMMPFKSSNYPGVRLGAPAVTNGPAPMGLSWLSSFMSQCGDCQIDFVPIHWYDSATNIAYFKNYLQQAHTQTGKPIWLTEFGFTQGSDQDIINFFNEILPWMDQQSWIERYSYFMCSETLLTSGTSANAKGVAYATA